ncbi:DHHA1 domain-containing protein [Bacillus infantis]|uniref:alanyl-tRNA editing protein n=1 Tax=Bacillus infantis TaxID=324767 RepID=UPI003450974E
MEKLYYQDPYIKEFTASVICQDQNSDGKWYAVLDRTAFYPTGGGQPFDTGTIHGISVTDVEEEEGEIRHYLEERLPESGEVDGRVNWQRRFDHMQQHAGQHILSAAFDELFGYRTVSFHLGKETLTIDIETENLSEEEAARAERKANEIITDNLPIETKWVSESELAAYTLRKETKVKENIRLVIIPEFDYNGCGGTHPRATGEVQAIKILGWSRQKKQTRVEFVCGGRVLKQLHTKNVIVNRTSQLVSSPEGEIPDAIIKLLDTQKQMEKELEELKNQLLEQEGKEYARSILDGSPIIRKVFRDRNVKELQKLAKSIAIQNDQAIVLFAAENGRQLQAVCASGTKTEADMKKIIQSILPAIQGRGGGNKHFAQGGGETEMSGERLLELMGDSL